MSSGDDLTASFQNKRDAMHFISKKLNILSLHCIERFPDVITLSDFLTRRQATAPEWTWFYE